MHISRSNPVTGTYWAARSSGSANRRPGDVCVERRIAVFDDRITELLRRFRDIVERLINPQTRMKPCR